MVHLKPFKSIPGPRAIPLFGTLYKYLPLTGKYSFKRLHRSGLLKYMEFGPLVRERLLMGVNLLYVFDPEDIRQVFANDGQYPFRRSHTALQKYRLDRPHMYTCGGLIPTNGEEWWRLRREAQKVMSRLQCVKAHLPVVNEICTDFLKFVENERDLKNETEDFLPLLKRVFLELTMQTTVDFRFNFLDTKSSFDSEASQLMWAADASTKSILPTDNGLQLWKWFNTPLYKKLIKGQDTIYRIALKYVDKKENAIREKLRKEKLDETTSHQKKETEELTGQLTALEYFILRSSLTKKDVLTLVCDSLLAGTDTSSFTTSFILYHLAKNPEQQQKMAEEARRLLSDTQGKVTDSVLNKARYTKAVVKESLRLNPISVGVGRMATKDFALRGYRIPKGTIIVTQNQVSCRLEEYFPNADRFLPERWLENHRSENPFLLLPFGHGPRACIGRRMAEQSILCLLLQMFDRFRISWEGNYELDCYSHLINEPDARLHFKFTQRT